MKKDPAPLRCVLIDDEPMGLHVLESHARQVPYVQVVASFASATQALAFLQTESVDLLFLDIQMPDLSGLEMAQIIGSSVPIIFTTAYAEYAVNGFELEALDYLLKPIRLSRFVQACQRAMTKRSQQGLPESETPDSLFVKTGYDWTRIDRANLLYVEADDNYLTFHEPSRRTLSRMKLSEARERLPADQFIRIHKSYIVSLSKVEKIERHQVTLITGAVLPVSALYRDELLNRLT